MLRLTRTERVRSMPVPATLSRSPSDDPAPSHFTHVIDDLCHCKRYPDGRIQDEHPAVWWELRVLWSGVKTGTSGAACGVKRDAPLDRKRGNRVARGLQLMSFKCLKQQISALPPTLLFCSWIHSLCGKGQRGSSRFCTQHSMEFQWH